MRNHSIFLSVIILLACDSFGAAPKCLLLKKDVDKRFYEFKCEKDLVKIQCEIKDEDICEVEIRDKLETLKFDLSNDQLKALNLFSAEHLTKIECDSKTKLCLSEKNVCENYKYGFDTIMKHSPGQSNASDRCDNFGMGEIRGFGDFSKQVVAKNEFNERDCRDKAKVALKALEVKLKLFKKSISLPFEDDGNFFKACLFLEKKADDGEINKIFHDEKKQFTEIRDRIVDRIEKFSQLEELVCQSNISSIYDNENLKIDVLMCIITEQARLRS